MDGGGGDNGGGLENFPNFQLKNRVGGRVIMRG